MRRTAAPIPRSRLFRIVRQCRRKSAASAPPCFRHSFRLLVHRLEPIARKPAELVTKPRATRLIPAESIPHGIERPRRRKPRALRASHGERSAPHPAPRLTAGKMRKPPAKATQTTAPFRSIDRAKMRQIRPSKRHFRCCKRHRAGRAETSAIVGSAPRTCGRVSHPYFALLQSPLGWTKCAAC